MLTSLILLGVFKSLLGLLTSLRECLKRDPLDAVLKFLQKDKRFIALPVVPVLGAVVSVFRHIPRF